MERNIGPLVVPLIGYGLLTAASIGGTYWGYRVVQQQQQSTDDQIARVRAEQAGAELDEQARIQRIITQLNPLMIAGTVVTAGLATFIMIRGRRDQRRQRRRELAEAF